MKIPFVALVAESLNKVDGLTGLFKRFFTLLTLPFVLIFSGLYAALTEAGRLFVVRGLGVRGVKANAFGG